MNALKANGTAPLLSLAHPGACTPFDQDLFGILETNVVCHVRALGSALDSAWLACQPSAFVDMQEVDGYGCRRHNEGDA